MQEKQRCVVVVLLVDESAAQQQPAYESCVDLVMLPVSVLDSDNIPNEGLSTKGDHLNRMDWRL